MHKEPVTKKVLYDIHRFLFPNGQTENLLDIRDFVIILLSFVGFFRFEEISKIQRNHLHLFFDYMYIDVVSSKTDTTHRGDKIHIARTSTELWALTWVTRYLSKACIADDSNELIFRSGVHNVKFNSWGLRKQNKRLAHSTVAEMFKKRLAQAGHNESNLTLHGLRAGGVSLAANAGVNEQLYRASGRWTSQSVGAYVEPHLQNKLSVTKKMNV